MDESDIQGDETISLSDVLVARDSCLPEDELWALCRECCLVLEVVNNSPDQFQTLCVTPDTVAFDQVGNVCFLDLDVAMPRGKGWKRAEARRIAMARIAYGRPVLGRNDRLEVEQPTGASDCSASLPALKSPSLKVALQSPAYEPATQSPAFKPATQSPAYEPATQSPAYEPATQSPAFKPATQSPAFKPASQSPAYEPATQSPAFKPATQSPAFEPATTGCPVNVQAPEQIGHLTQKHNIDKITQSNNCQFMERSASDPATPKHIITPISNVVVFKDCQSEKPYHSNMFVQGSFSQEDRQFSAESRGSQCVTNALCSLIYAKYSDLHETHSLDKILIDGDQLYKKIISDLKSCGKFKYYFLNFGEIPEVVFVLTKNIEVIKSDVISGVCIEQFGEIQLPSMHQALHNAFLESSYLLVMIGSVCSAVFKKDAEYYIFDSHPHGSNGLAAENGKSILLSFYCLEDLVTYMYAVYDSMHINLNSQFDMLPVRFFERVYDMETTDNNIELNRKSVSNGDGASIIADVNHWQTVSKKRSKKRNKNDETSESKVSAHVPFQSRMVSKSSHNEDEVIKKFMRNLTTSSNDCNVTLIGRYMNDHLHRKMPRKQTDRRQYQQLYKKKQRNSSEFRANERPKEKAYKQIERQSNEYNSKEKLNQREYRLKKRQCIEDRVKEQVQQREYRLKKRQCSKDRAKEQVQQREYRLKKRQCSKDRAKEQVQQRKYRLKKRQCSKDRAKEQVQQREYRLKKRQCSEDRAIERSKEKAIKQIERQSNEFKSKEQVQQREYRLTKRLCSEDRAIERSKEKVLKQIERQSSEFKSKEQVQQKEYRLQKRQCSEDRAKERVQEKASMRRKRLLEQYRIWEAEQKRTSRESDDFRQKESIIQRLSKRKARKNPNYQQMERVKKQQQRSQARYKDIENTQCSSQKALKRKNDPYRDREKHNAKQRKYGSNIDSCIEIFQQTVSEGPIYICSCCHQTWFRHSVYNATVLNSDQRTRYLTGTVSAKEKEWICGTCKSSILNGKIPTLSALNGMKWPVKPKELDLFPLEERLIALRIPFMQMRELPRGRQLSVKGNVVNVPVDIQPVVSALPRPFDENVTVAVKLKKKMSFKSCVFSENVRPLRVLVALHWLMKNSDMYRNSNVDIDEEWIKSVMQTCNEIIQEFVSNDDTNECTKSGNQTSSCNQNVHSEQQQNTVNSTEINLTEELYDSDTEETSHENVGNIDTLVDDANLENRNSSSFTFAPGENQRPLSIYQDKDSEYLCFPSIYCGQRRKENEEREVHVSYSDIAKWELRSCDRRAANSVPNIFFKLKKIQMKQLNDKVNLAVRRCQGDTSKLTAEQARNPDTINNIVSNDEGYYIFKQLRNSPAYLETKKKDVFAMIRQLGLPTWFLSLSSADTRWGDLLKILANLNKRVNYDNDQIANLTWEQKIKLIQSDPVTCSRYFDNRVQEFINKVLKSEHKPLGKVTDFFYRVEFQQRGSPHIHMIVWIENAPKYNVDSNEAIATYVDGYLQCRIEDEDMNQLIDLQVHKHSRTCRKKQDRICRFGYPLPPLPKTMVLSPLETDKDKYEKLYQKLQKEMNDMKDGYDMSYEQFLHTVAMMSEDDYIKSIRSSLKTSKVFMKRNPNEIRVNLYNKAVLKAWKANIDIQFVLDPYACAMYIVSYISKSQRGMSNLLHAAATEARNGNLDIKRQVRHIGNVFSNSVEVSAQEAAYLILQMPLTKCTRDVVFINTSPPNKRIQLLKPKSTLDQLPAKSTNIVADNIVKRYSRRPKVLKDCCLADYVSQYDVIYPVREKENPDEQRNDDQFLESENEEQYDDSKKVITLKNGIKIKHRSNFKVIRYVRFNQKTDQENYFREKILLFHPWRDEEKDLLGNFNTYKEHYESVKHPIDEKSSTYEHHVEELELARSLAEVDEEAYDQIAPAAQQTEAETAKETAVDSESFVYFNPDRVIEHRQYDIGIEIGCSVSQPQVNQNERILPENEYRALLQCLNTKQKQFYNHVIHWLKTRDAPLYAFLSGGAGVGKSVVIRALYQTLYRYLNLKEGENVDDIRILLCAYTGKAAFNISGSTISTAFKQKFKQPDQTLTCDNLNTFRTKYKNLSVVIIDEISMVGNSLLSFINQRLQELKGTRTPFGGVSIIAVGDLYQLKPINGTWIFNDLTRDASALSTNLWKDHFTIFELTDIMRQKDDLDFAELLNRLRRNMLTHEDKETLSKCKIESKSPEHLLYVPHLFAENYFMHAFNDSIMNNMENEKVTIPCNDLVLSPKLSKEKQDEAISKLPTDPSLTANLHCSLTIVISMIYDLTVNTNTEDGLANGASCVVKYVEYKQKETNRPSIIWVQLDDSKAGNETRNKFRNRGYYHNQIQDTWTPIFDIERSFLYNRKTYQRIQFPLQPSAGRTVHRAQGSTLEKVVIDLSQRKPRKIPHLHYVALSRVRSLKNLQILNFNEHSLKVDDQVEMEMERLHSDSMLKLCYVPLETIDSHLHFKFAFNNCRSLHLHFDDIKNDQGLLSCHVFGLAETRLNQLDTNSDYNIKGYKLIRNDQQGNDALKRPPHGLVIYLKDDLHVTSQIAFSSVKFEFIKVDIISRFSTVQFVVLYKAPSMRDNDFVQSLEKELIPLLDKHKPLVVMGDFNLDVSKKHRLVQSLIKKLNCTMLMNQPTTDNLSVLDLVFSNTDGISGTIETYWSDHKIVFFYSKV